MGFAPFTSNLEGIMDLLSTSPLPGKVRLSYAPKGDPTSETRESASSRIR
jgi:hypothetical protein